MEQYLTEVFQYEFWCINKDCSMFSQIDIKEQPQVINLMLKDKHNYQYCKKCNTCMLNKGIYVNKSIENSYNFAYANINTSDKIKSTREILNNRFKRIKNG